MTTLPDNWNSMTGEEQDAWSIQRYLHTEFPELSFTVTAHPFMVIVDQDDADPEPIKAKVDKWYSHSYGPGAHVDWGTPVHVDAQ
jgi:hypothetical protein